MKTWKKCLAAVLSLAIMASATACSGADKSWAVKNDNLTVPIGAYIYNLYSAYQQASVQVEDSTKPILEQTVEDQDAATWIKENALRQTKSILVIDDKMKELNISLTEDELQQVSDQTDSYWGSISTAMTEYGVAKSSFNLAYADYYTKYTKVFDAIYGKGGTQEVSDADVKDYYVTNYMAFSYVLAPIIDMTTGTNLSEDELSQLDTEFKDYAAKINDGSMTAQEAADAYKTSSGDDTVQLYTDAANFNGETSSYPEEFGTSLKSMKDGECRIVEVQGLYKVLLVKDDVTATAENKISDEASRTAILQNMKQEEFKQMIDRGDLSFVITGNSSADDILDELKQGEYQESSSGESRFRGLQDIDGKIAYINCWNYDGTKIPGDYKTVNGETVLQLVNNSKIWNGRLSDAYRMINDAAEIIYSDVDNYVLNQKQYQEGNTNITYLYVNRDNGTVITNKKKYRDYDHYEESLEQIKKSGKYVIVRPKLADYESNIEKAGKGDSMAQEWQKTVAGYVNASDYVYASVVDTAYPVKDDFYEQKQIFTQYAAGAKAAGIGAVLAVAAYLAILVLLTIGAGRSAEDEEVHLVKFDHIKTEPAAVGVILLWAVVMLVVTKAGIFTWQSVNGETIYTENKQIYLQGMAVGCLGALYSCAMFLLGYLSLVRRIKAKTVWKNSVFRWLLLFLKEMLQNIRYLWKMMIGLAAFLLFHWLTYIFAADGSTTWAWAFILLVTDAAAFVWMVQKAKGTGKIMIGIEKIAGGEVEYQIPVNGLLAEQKEIAEKVNSIGEGLETALAKSMKSERLKTDLITNVSHDIKTPLTSIINYVELLKQEDFKDPKIRRYIEVLEQKSQRLKTLTEDVVEASKVSSGNITLEFMNLNLVEMIQQTSGEFEEKFKAGDLEEVMNLPNEEIVIRADGRRLWRVLSNIYNNAAKYAMQGTRVYADLEKKDGMACFSLKNISARPLNIPASELTERFIRGDVSRSTEGSGLGLSIAQSLTEMQGGTFELYLDGDLFKVTIKFPVS